jgi:large subunit ribosomal protein L29
MKKRELQELKNKPVAEYHRLINEDKEKLRSLKFDLAAGKVKNINELRSLKKNIARMETFIKEKGSEINKEIKPEVVKEKIVKIKKEVKKEK